MISQPQIPNFTQNELMKLKLKFINLHFSIFWVLKEFWQNQIFLLLKNPNFRNSRKGILESASYRFFPFFQVLVLKHQLMVCILCTVVCLHFITNVSCLFTFAAVCLHFLYWFPILDIKGKYEFCHSVLIFHPQKYRLSSYFVVCYYYMESSEKTFFFLYIHTHNVISGAHATTLEKWWARQNLQVHK